MTHDFFCLWALKRWAEYFCQCHRLIVYLLTVTANPSQEGQYNSINPLVEGVPHIFAGLHLGGPTHSQALNIHGTPTRATPLSLSEVLGIGHCLQS